MRCDLAHMMLNEIGIDARIITDGLKVLIAQPIESRCAFGFAWPNEITDVADNHFHEEARL